MLLGITLLLSSCLQISVSINRVYSLTAKRFASSNLQCYSTEKSGSVQCSEGQRCGTWIGSATITTSECVNAGECSTEKSYEKCLMELIESGEICCCDSPDCNEIVVYDYVTNEDNKINNNDTEQLSTKESDEWQRNSSSLPLIAVANVSEKAIMLRRDASESGSNGEQSSDSIVLTSPPASTSTIIEYSEAEETAFEEISEPMLENSTALLSEASPLAPDVSAEQMNSTLEAEGVEVILTILAAQSVSSGELESSTASQLFEEIPSDTEQSLVEALQATTASSQPEIGLFSLENPFPLTEPEAAAEAMSTEGPNSSEPEPTTELSQSQEQLYPSAEAVSVTEPEPSSATSTTAMMEAEPLAETASANEAELASTSQPESPSDTPLSVEPEAELAPERSSTTEAESSSSFASVKEPMSSTEPMTTEENQAPSDESSVDQPSTVEPQQSSMTTSPAVESSAETVPPLMAATEAVTHQHIEVPQASDPPQEPEGNSAHSKNVLVPLCIAFFTTLLYSVHNYC